MAEALPDAVGQCGGWSAVIQRLDQFLLDHLDPDFGLLEVLVTNKTLSIEQREIVTAEATTNQRNRKLLDIIRSEDKSDGLIDALKSSKQTHIVKYLEADGKYQSEFASDWPLSAHQLTNLDCNHGVLVDLIEMTDLLGLLFSKAVINKRQRDEIASLQMSHRKNEAFLEVLRRRSQTDYNNTIRCLQELNQIHIAQILHEGGAIVGVHVETDEATEKEREITEKITTVLGNTSEEERRRILDHIQLSIIAAKPGQ